MEAEAVDAGDGGDVAERNPDLIQREIEQTRAELADTIDAIADRISPRRAASRGAHAVKQSVSSVLNGHGGNGHSGSNGQAPAAVLDAPPTAAGHADAKVRSIAAGKGGSAWTGTGSYVVSRRLRTDRVLLAVGAVAAAAGAVILWRSRD